MMHLIKLKKNAMRKIKTLRSLDTHSFAYVEEDGCCYQALNVLNVLAHVVQLILTFENFTVFCQSYKRCIPHDCEMSNTFG